MTADKTQEPNGQTSTPGMPRAVRRRTPRKRASSRAASAKASRTTTTRRSTATRRRTAGKNVSTAARNGRSHKPVRGILGLAARLGLTSRVLSRGRRAAGDAYEWAADTGGRAMPLASRFADNRLVQRLADERPYMLGALGFGIGAIIGLMLPSPLGMMGGSHGSRGGARNRR